MELTSALLNALRDAAGPDVKSIELALPHSILLTHVSGTQLRVNAHALAPHIMGDPEKLVIEARGALAALTKMAEPAQPPGEQDVQALIVPVLRSADWIEAAARQSRDDLVKVGLALPLGRSLFITYAIEHADRRVPVLDWRELGGIKAHDLPELARENQMRMVKQTIQDLSATDLGMGDGTFFLRSKNLQAASLILQPFAWELIASFAPEPPKATIGAVVGPEAILFGPADPSDTELYAGMLRASLRGLRKSFGGDGDWGEDIFTFDDSQGGPKCLS
jgi:hypothetical protein